MSSPGEGSDPMTDDTAAIPALGARAPSAARGEGQRLGLALLVISLTQLMLVLDELIVNTALPHIQQALHFSGTSLEWVATGYAVTFGGLLILGRPARDVLCPPPTRPRAAPASRVRAPRRAGAAHSRPPPGGDRTRRHLALGRPGHDRLTRRRRGRPGGVRGHRGPLPAAAAAAVALRQPRQGGRLP